MDREKLRRLAGDNRTYAERVEEVLAQDPLNERVGPPARPLAEEALDERILSLEKVDMQAPKYSAVPGSKGRYATMADIERSVAARPGSREGGHAAYIEGAVDRCLDSVAEIQRKGSTKDDLWDALRDSLEEARAIALKLQKLR